MAESGAKDDASDIDEDELNAATATTTHPGGEGSNAPKGMSLKGKEEWKDVSLPRIGGGGVGGGGSSSSSAGVDNGGKVGPGGARNGGPTRSSPHGNGQKGKTRDHVDYHGTGAGTNGMSQQQHATANAASRTLTGSWTGHDGGSGAGGYQYERDDGGSMGHEDHRVSEARDARHRTPRIRKLTVSAVHQSQANFYQPTKQPSLATLYPRGVRPHDQDRPMNPTLHNDTHSFRSEPSRYNSYDTPAFTENTPSSHMNSLHSSNNNNNNGGLGSSSSPVSFENPQAYAQYSLPVDSGINSDGSIDWHKASAAAQLQAALHAQQAQLAYLRQQRQQQEHWRELLAASAGGNGSMSGLPPGMGGGGGGGGAAVGNAVQRFNELVAAGHDPMALSNGFQWPTGGSGGGGPGPGGSGLGLSTVPGSHPSRDHMLDLSVSANPEWYAETSMRSQGGVPFSSHMNDGRPPKHGLSRDTSPSSRQPSGMDGDGGRGDLSDGGNAGLKRERVGGDEMGNHAKRPRMESMGGNS